MFALLLALALLPPSAPYSALGCTINSTTDSFHNQWIHTHVWVKYDASTEWKKLYSIRPGDDPRKSMKECDAWLREAKKNLPKPVKEKQ